MCLLVLLAVVRECNDNDSLELSTVHYSLKASLTRCICRYATFSSRQRFLNSTHNTFCRFCLPYQHSLCHRFCTQLIEKTKIGISFTTPFDSQVFQNCVVFIFYVDFK